MLLLCVCIACAARTLTAQPSQSKPGPRLAMVAGAKAVTCWWLCCWARVGPACLVLAWACQRGCRLNGLRW